MAAFLLALKPNFERVDRFEVRDYRRQNPSHEVQMTSGPPDAEAMLRQHATMADVVLHKYKNPLPAILRPPKYDSVHRLPN